MNNGGSRRTHLIVRERINILLGRSLLLGSLHSGIKVHDIVLRAMRSRFTPDELREAHCRFANHLIKTSSFEPTSARSPAPGTEIDWYKSVYLVWHVQAALHPEAADVPLREEPNANEVLAWIDADKRTLGFVTQGIGTKRIQQHAQWLDGQS